MLLSGLTGTALMLTAGAIMVWNAPAAGPGQEATWPTGETMMLDRIPNKPNSGDPTATCTLTPEGRPAEHNRWFAIGRSTSPDFTGAATITCDQQVALLTGTPRLVADYTRGPLIAVPLLVTVLGILLFFPRFTHSWARLATRGWLRKILRIPPPTLTTGPVRPDTNDGMPEDLAGVGAAAAADCAHVMNSCSRELPMRP